MTDAETLLRRVGKRPTMRRVLRRKVYERDGWRCKKCLHPSDDGKDFEVHHIVEVCAGGTDDIENLDTLCRMCHAEWTWVWITRDVPYERWLTIAPMYTTFRAMLAVLDGVDIGIPRDIVEFLLLAPRELRGSKVA